MMLTAFGSIAIIISCKGKQTAASAKRPNILFVIADDQSYPYTSIYGTKGVNTPAFDAVAKSGILFNNALFFIRVLFAIFN